MKNPFTKRPPNAPETPTGADRPEPAGFGPTLKAWLLWALVAALLLGALVIGLGVLKGCSIEHSVELDIRPLPAASAASSR